MIPLGDFHWLRSVFWVSYSALRHW